jgi:hypothetical protein
VVRNGWIALFAHDPNVPAAHLHEHEGRWEVAPVKID